MLRFQSLDGWRGIAAVFVSLYHLNFFNHLHDWAFLRNSYLFVDFFFVLSGFVIAHAYQNKLKNTGDITHFINKRLSRLLPLHLFILSLFLVLEILKLILTQFGAWNMDASPFTGEYSIPSLISNVFLIHSLGLHNHLSWNYPSWSISVEFYTYILFAFIGAIGYKYQTLKWPLYSILIGISFYYIYSNTQNLNDATYHFGIFRCIIGFFLGSICYRLFLLTKTRTIPHATLIEISLIVLIYFFTTYLGKEKLSIIAPIIFTLTVYIFSFEQGLISRLLKVKPLQNLGKWSYSIYMVHALLILLIGRTINLVENLSNYNFSIAHSYEGKDFELIYYNSSYVMDLLTIAFLVVLIYISSLTYKYVEMKMSSLNLSKYIKR